MGALGAIVGSGIGYMITIVFPQSPEVPEFSRIFATFFAIGAVGAFGSIIEDEIKKK